MRFLFPVCRAEGGWQGVLTVITCFFLTFDLGGHTSVQIIVVSNAQLDIKPPSPPWVSVDRAWAWSGGIVLSASQICFVLLLP